MDVQALRQLKPELDLFLERYAAWFGRDETQDHANRFVQGLLLGGDRRSVENIAEAIDGCVVRSLQKFIAQSPWSDDRVVEELQRHVSEVLGDADASLNVDETGFPKKGTKSVGVKRQYAGCLGRTDNCQVGVCVNYRSAAGHTLIDRRLFLPEEWAADYPRREEAGVPEAVVFRTKPELAVEMVQQAVERGLPFRWVTADSVYGNSPTFVQGIRGLGKWYVVVLLLPLPIKPGPAFLAVEPLASTRVKSRLHHAHAGMARRLALQQVRRPLQLQVLKEVIDPDDVEVLDASLVGRIGDILGTAALDAGNRHSFSEPAYELKGGLEILVSDHGDGDIVGKRNRGEIEHRGRQGDIDALFFGLEWVGRITVSLAKPPASVIDGEDLDLVMMLFAQLVVEIEPPLHGDIIKGITVRGVAAEEVDTDNIHLGSVQMVPNCTGQHSG